MMTTTVTLKVSPAQRTLAERINEAVAAFIADPANAHASPAAIDLRVAAALHNVMLAPVRPS